MSDTSWASDVPVSMPVPYRPDEPVVVDMGGFGFTLGGVAHNISEADVEEWMTPVFAPEGEWPK